MCLKQRWMGCTGAVQKSRYIFFKGHVGSLDGVHRCSSKIQIYIFERSRWIVGWGALVQFKNPDIYFERSRWIVGRGAPVHVQVSLMRYVLEPSS